MCLVTVVCVCVSADVTEVYDTMSCLPIVSDRAGAHVEDAECLAWVRFSEHKILLQIRYFRNNINSIGSHLNSVATCTSRS